MNESQFRALMREAIGEESIQPWVPSAVVNRLQAPARAMPRPWLIGATLAVAIASAALLVPQLTANRNHTIVPAVSPSPSPVAVDPSDCSLPVVLGPGKAGFIDTSSSGFIPDSSAGPDAVSYSPAARRWVPVPASQVSPDGGSYAWLSGRELHVTDVRTGRDSGGLWTSSTDVNIWRWEARGIRLGENAFSAFTGTASVTWLVDPKTGLASQETVPGTGMPFYPPGVAGTRWAFRPLGTDADAHVIWWFHNLDLPNGVDLIFVERSPTDVTYIRNGAPNDGFVPHLAFGDATGVWFLDDIHNTIWHWQPGGELTKLQPPPRASMLKVESIAGPCF